MTQSKGFVIAISLVFFALGCAMVYVTWINPASRLRPMFSARWTLFGRVASKFGALAQSFTLLSLGLLVLLSGLGSTFTKVAFIPLAIGVLATGIARLGDLRDDEA